MADLLQRPISYLVRLGEMSKDYPALSDPPLSDEGIKQAEEAAEFLSYSGFSIIEMEWSRAATQFAEIIKSSNCETSPDLPNILILNGDNVSVARVNPGGIVAAYCGEDKRLELVPMLKEKEFQESC